MQEGTLALMQLAKTCAALARLSDAGVPFIGSCVARFDPGAREHFFGFLQRNYPDLVERYERLYQGAHAAPDYVRDVTQVVSDEAGRVGLARRASH